MGQPSWKLKHTQKNPESLGEVISEGTGEVEGQQTAGMGPASEHCRLCEGQEGWEVGGISAAWKGCCVQGPAEPSWGVSATAATVYAVVDRCTS